jgi:hypothetical protein
MERGDALPGLRRLAHAWLTDLANRWPDAQPLPLYPAFATSREG